jgi:hypothetical protein
VFDENKSYIIARSELAYGFFVLLKFIKILGDNSSVFIFKLYKERMKGDKFSQIGHTVSIYASGGKLFYVDPQQSIFNDITALDYLQLTSYVQGLYQFNFIDIVFFISPEKSSSNIVLTELLNSPPGQQVDIVQRTKDINFGGKIKRKTKSKKNRSMKNKSKRHKKQHFKTKMKTLKKKNYSKYKQYGRGDDDDDYINMVEKIDKTNKVESLILTNDEL